MNDHMTPRGHTIFLVSDDAKLRAAARHELETIDDRRHVSSVSTLDAARRIVEDAAPAVILLAEAAATPETGDLQERGQRLDLAVSSLATYAPVVVIGEADHQTELSSLVAAGAADYVVRTDECLAWRSDWSSAGAQSPGRRARCGSMRRAAPIACSTLVFPEFERKDFGEVLRHELNNPLTGILGNAELLLAQNTRKLMAACRRERLSVLKPSLRSPCACAKRCAVSARNGHPRQHPVPSP